MKNNKIFGKEVNVIYNSSAGVYEGVVNPEDPLNKCYDLSYFNLTTACYNCE